VDGSKEDRDEEEESGVKGRISIVCGSQHSSGI